MVTHNMENNVEILHPTYNRFDFGFKFLFLDEIVRLERKSSFSKEKIIINSDLEKRWGVLCYKEHIKAFSLGSYKEPGNPEKNNIYKYYSVFIDLYFDILNNGFDGGKSKIPLAADGSILDGSHRASVSIFTRKTVSVAHQNLPAPMYNYKFFQDRGVPGEMLDAAAKEFVRFDDHCYIALFWPAGNVKKIDPSRYLEKVVYKKEIKLTDLGAHNLISLVYEGEPWIGYAKNNYKGARDKVRSCFPNSSELIVYVFQADALDRVVEIKKLLRDLFQIGNSSVHITDTKAEALMLSEYLLNNNSIHFLNYAKPNKYWEAMDRNLSYFRDFLKENCQDQKNFVLDSGMVMMAYGLRSASDIDYISSAEFPQKREFHLVGDHSSETVYHERKASILVHDPRYYFQYKGIKFVNIYQVSLMKKNRGEEKDIADISLIGSINSHNLFMKEISFAFSRFKFLCFKWKVIIRRCVGYILKSVGLYDVVKKLLKEKDSINIH